MVHRLETVIRMDFVKTTQPCHGRSRTLQTAANGWPHSHMSPECGRHLCHETACRVRERQGSVGPDGADDAFLSLVLRKCTTYSHNAYASLFLLIALAQSEVLGRLLAHSRADIVAID